MFRLQQFFLITSTAGLVALAGLLWFAHGYAVRQLVEYAEVQNVALARSFANTLWPRFSGYISSVSGLPDTTLRNHPEIGNIQRAVKDASKGLSVLKVKIYNLDGTTVYSSEPKEIGENNSDNPGFRLAAQKGLSASKLTYKNRFNTFEGSVEDRDFVESYLPMRHDDGVIHGVFELYSDVTPLLGRINQASIQLLIGLLSIFGLLYGALYLLVRRADRTIKSQYANIEDKNAQLESARDSLEIRIAERTRALTEEIADRVRAEESLRKLSQAVDQSPAMTIITDPAGSIEYVNARFTAVTGYTLDDVLGSNPRILKAGEVPPETYRELWNTITAGREWRGEIHNRKKDGALYWASTTISPVSDAKGDITHFLGISEDITELKRIQQERHRQQAELAHAGRVIILGEMATSLAHELNQPLSVISGCAQLCRKTLQTASGDGDALSEAVDQIFEQADRANEIIHSIRGFVHKDPPGRESVSLNLAVERIADLLRGDAREHGAAISFEFADHLPPVAANMLQIQQVILNLAHNGIEAMVRNAPDRRRLVISTARLDDGSVAIDVGDSGPGIPSDAMDSVFEPFFTLKPDGIGMGLSISRTIVEAHGGELSVISNTADGACFRVSLPPATEAAAHGL